jgi:5,5'-dehydrodivanillate O-demethylase oxygenase subunit
MLTAARNDMLTRVGPGTPMGNLLRRYWMPIGGASELAQKPTKPVRFFGENLTLYKDLSGHYGLIARRCPHRGADLSNGIVEEHGIRCFYHGWKYDERGQCIEQPYEDIANPSPKSRDGCSAVAYPVRELAGLLWAYMGPEPPPELPVWEPFTFANGFREIVLADVPCNWFQCQENSIDPVHFEWMHDNWSATLRGHAAQTPRTLKLKFDEFEHGFIYRRIREGSDETDVNWSVGRVALWPNGFYLGMHFEWRVPVDDENTLSVSWFFVRVPTDREPYVQDSIPTWVSPVHDDKGEWIVSHIINQDIVGWASQGRIADRRHENLRSSDIGITMMRKRFFEDLDRIAKGQDPSSIVRDPAVAKCIALPDAMRKYNVEGVPLADYAKHPLLRERLARFRHHYGQPAEVRSAFAEAMGLK